MTKVAPLCRVPDHVNHFSPASLRCMARDAGHKLSLVHPLRQPLDDNIDAGMRPVGASNGNGQIERLAVALNCNGMEAAED